MKQQSRFFPGMESGINVGRLIRSRDETSFLGMLKNFYSPNCASDLTEFDLISWNVNIMEHILILVSDLEVEYAASVTEETKKHVR